MARPSSGVWFKWQYDKSQMQAIVEAGFASVRIFMPYAAKLEETQEQIEDALEAGLSIVVCMWGLSDWASNRQVAPTINCAVCKPSPPL